MAVEKKPGAEPLRGYTLLEPLGRGGFGEVWKCEAPGGIFKAIKFVYGDMASLDGDARHAESELRAVELIKSIRHPFLLAIDRVEKVQGELIIVTELADLNLHQMLHRARCEGRVGLPREELLNYLREAAEVLDLLNLKFDLQHLDVKPANLFLVANHVKVADFGMVQSLSSGPGGKGQMGGITPLYAAPEVFQGKLSRHADQYSLAIVFQELFTGNLPFKGKNSRQLFLEHAHMEPDLSSLPEEDRPLVGRALAKNPEHRFASCLEFVRALLGEGKVLRSAASAPEEPAPETLTGAAQGVTLDAPPAAPPLPPEILPGFRFLHQLGNSPLQESWLVQTPDGSDRLVKFVYGFARPDAQGVKEAIARWRSLHHPGLALQEVIHLEPGRMVLLGDLVKETLRDRYQQCRAQKIPGIRRGEMLEYLRAACEVLDYLYRQHGIQHLTLHPRLLQLDGGWLQLGDFGLAQLLWRPAGQTVVPGSIRYAPPELLQGNVSRTVDQFSLAVIFVEMTTGVHPFGGRNPAVGSRWEPDLSGLGEQDQNVVRRALDPDPTLRWPTLLDFVLALEGTRPEEAAQFSARPDHFAGLIADARAATGRHSGFYCSEASRIVAEILASQGAKVAEESQASLPTWAPEGDRLQLRFQAGLPLGSARLKLQDFHRTWQGTLLRDDEAELLFEIRTTGDFWNRLRGRRPGMTVRIGLARVQPLSPTPIEVVAELTALPGGGNRSLLLVERLGPVILEKLRDALLTGADKRAQERVLWPHPVLVVPIDGQGRTTEPIEARGKDISSGGMGLYLPHDLDTAEVLIELPDLGNRCNARIPATLVRARPTTDGWYDVGALFRLTSPRHSQAEIDLARVGG